MDASVVTTAVSAASALAAAAVTYALTKRREREAEWRRFKIDQYREYVAALSGVTQASPSLTSASGGARFREYAGPLYVAT